VRRPPHFVRAGCTLQLGLVANQPALGPITIPEGPTGDERSVCSTVQYPPAPPTTCIFGERACARRPPFPPRRLHSAARTCIHLAWVPITTAQERSVSSICRVSSCTDYNLFWGERACVRRPPPCVCAGCTSQLGRVANRRGSSHGDERSAAIPKYPPAPTTTCFGESARVCVVRPLASAQAALRS